VSLLRPLVFTTVALLISAGPAFAWGKTGHRVSGEIAEHYLSDESRAAIEAILGVEDLAEASTWADFMRASQEPFWQKTAGPLHYLTIPEGKRYADVGAPPQGNAITALDRFRSVLLDPDSTLEQQQLALRFIIHVVGDIHQPLHAGNGTDRGGNAYVVTYFGSPTNLHSVWDSKMIDSEQLSYTEMTEWLLRRITAEDVDAWWNTDPIVWAEESATIRDGIYPVGDARDIRWDYLFEHKHTIEKRLSQAGVRMAAYLNELFAEYSPD